MFNKNSKSEINILDSGFIFIMDFENNTIELSEILSYKVLKYLW